jgi:hypothetical protein
MASNFGIGIHKNSTGFGLKLAGNFDGTSAYELICAIKKLPKETAKICIYLTPFWPECFSQVYEFIKWSIHQICVHRQ